jgi:hypothetical protein
MRLIGESFKDYVVSQIDVRQSLAGSGYNNSRRTDQQIQLLSNRNAWLKLASSVRILSEADVKANLIKSGVSEDEAILAVNNYENGEKRLKKIGFNNTSDLILCLKLFLLNLVVLLKLYKVNINLELGLILAMVYGTQIMHMV